MTVAIDEERLPSVETLSHRSFFVPSYQRGYRWTPEEVRELLADIRQFAGDESGDAGEFYCLQPLVVRLMDSGEWEVIDGQQRLTTIYLITRYIKEMCPRRDKDTVLALHYESRERTRRFLDGLAVNDDGTVDFNDDNIDFAHISKAYQTIVKWVEDAGGDLDKDQFASALRRRVRVIWYEPTGSDGVQIFTRINRGKIPLTNAELIRGLFLKSSNFIGAGASPDQAESARLRQMEISVEWDRIESALHDDKFWYFLTGPNDHAETRIDLVFRLLTGIFDDDSYALFRAYSETFPSKPDVSLVSEQWDRVKGCFQQLQDWYLDWELYHLIGYLIATGTSLIDLWYESTGLRKSEFRENLKSRIRESLPKASLESLEYRQAAVRKVLLLHNVLTNLESCERHFRFPFNRFKNQKWDVEHIHSVAENSPESDLHRREWLKDAAEHLRDEKLKAEVENFVVASGWGESEFDA
ncbi:MAG: DUF262 domain-containing protein, partial [Verrucomicrobiae bacterium]|nr:DUF262 domain-containing protein [Verrucomicrobiae bacterium]